MRYVCQAKTADDWWMCSLPVGHETDGQPRHAAGDGSSMLATWTGRGESYERTAQPGKHTAR